MSTTYTLTPVPRFIVGMTSDTPVVAEMLRTRGLIMETRALDVTFTSSNGLYRMDAEETPADGGSTTRAAMTIPLHCLMQL